jgi:outer membrane lipoprotein-sorting protein
MSALRRLACPRLAFQGALLLPLLLTGCSLLPTTRKLPVPKAPLVTQTISPEQLVSRLNQRWNAIRTLTATVEMQPSVTRTKEGVAKDYPSVHGNILLRKPSDLRVLGRYFGVSVFDMASNGDCFTLSIPHDDKVIKGCGPPKTMSASTWENLRPGFFFDALLVRGLDPNNPDEKYSVTSETLMVEDAAKKHLFSVPEYILRIARARVGSQKETPVRVVYFHRDDLLPYQQDIYDSDGNLETQVTYSAYQEFEGGKYPSSVTIKRPLEGIQIVLTIDTVHENEPLPNDQFVLKPPEGATVVNRD